MPNIRGTFQLRKDCGFDVTNDTLSGAFKINQSKKFPRFPEKYDGGYSYGIKLDASEGGTKKVWKDGASVKSRNFTYKVWTRIF